MTIGAYILDDALELVKRQVERKKRALRESIYQEYRTGMDCCVVSHSLRASLLTHGCSTRVRRNENIEPARTIIIRTRAASERVRHFSFAFEIQRELLTRSCRKEDQIDSLFTALKDGEDELTLYAGKAAHLLL